NAVCTSGTSAILTASGASTYSWLPVTNLTPGSGTSATETVQISQLTFYTVTGTGSNGCTNDVIVPVATVATGGTISPNFSIICSGGTKTLTVTGAAGHDYIWEISSNNTTWDTIPGATNTTYTTVSGDGNTNKFYRLLARSNSCWNVASTTSEVDVSTPAITVTATSVTDNSLVLNWTPIGTGNYNITYSGASSGLQTGVTPPKTITGLTANGNYTIVVTQTGVSGCSATGTVGASTLCAQPTNLTATPTTAGTLQELTVSWSGPVGNYRVYYRPLYSYTTFFTQDVTNATSTILKKQGPNNLFSSNTYQIYVSSLDCPHVGNVGQPTGSVYVTTNPISIPGCASPTIDTVFSTCPVLMEVQLHGGSGVYNIYIQRLTPSLLQVNSYVVSGGDFVINVGAGQQYLVSADSKCGSTVSTLNLWHNQVTIKPTCNAPSNLVLSNPTCHGFTASWNADQCLSNTVSGYAFFMRQVGSINYNAYTVPLPSPGIGPHLVVNILPSGKNIQTFVQSIYSCGGSVTYGPASQIATITTLSGGCRDDEDVQQTQESKPAVQQYSADNDEVFSLYPNPNTGEFTVDLSRLSNNTDEVRIEVMNMIGQTVITQITGISGGHMRQFINLPNGTAAGTYIVRLTAGKNVYTAKINVSK
ncbi:MAG TPA: T9SS type A sorting domain-containing protein, partial [Candidatus Saccharimonadales bacterium]